MRQRKHTSSTGFCDAQLFHPRRCFALRRSFRKVATQPNECLQKSGTLFGRLLKGTHKGTNNLQVGGTTLVLGASKGDHETTINISPSTFNKKKQKQNKKKKTPTSRLVLRPESASIPAWCYIWLERLQLRFLGNAPQINDLRGLYRHLFLRLCETLNENWIMDLSFCCDGALKWEVPTTLLGNHFKTN